MPTNKPVRFSVSLPDWFERKLCLWASSKGTSRAALASNILQARIEANWDNIEKDMKSIANYHGMTVQELEAEWLDETNSSDA